MEIKLSVFVCVFVMLVVVLLGGCAPSEPLPIPTPTRTPLASTPTAVPPTSTPLPTPTPAATPDPYPGWASYENGDYGIAFRYPVTWGLIEIPAGGEEAPTGPAAHTVRLMREGLQLGIQVKRESEAHVMGPSGRGAGEIVERGTVTLLNSTLPKQVLVYEGKDKSLFLGGQIDELEIYVQLDIEHTPGADAASEELSAEVQAEVDAILRSFMRTITPPQPAADVAASDAPVLGDTRTRAADGMTMVYVPAGEFVMGSDDDDVAYYVEMCEHYGPFADCSDPFHFQGEQPAHPVALDAFWVDQTEVSYAHFQACVDAGVCQAPLPPMERQGPIEVDPDYPVTVVFWEQAQTYCEWVGGRLPTEAEWEYVARGPGNLRFPWGDTFDPRRLNYCDAKCGENWGDESTYGKSWADPSYDDGYATMAPVGSYPDGVSWCGALDMAGNVGEWTADWQGVYTVDRQVNPTGPEGQGERKIIKGFSWYQFPLHLRSANREAHFPEGGSAYVGFRCVVPVE